MSLFVDMNKMCSKKKCIQSVSESETDSSEEFDSEEFESEDEGMNDSEESISDDDMLDNSSSKKTSASKEKGTSKKKSASKKNNSLTKKSTPKKKSDAKEKNVPKKTSTTKKKSVPKKKSIPKKTSASKKKTSSSKKMSVLKKKSVLKKNIAPKKKKSAPKKNSGSKCINKEIPWEKSFASVKKSKYLSPKNNVDPRNLSKSSRTKYIFECNKCHHEFDTSPSKVTEKHFCPFCTNQRLCSNIDCEICEQNSFQSHPRSRNWSPLNSESPRNIFKRSGKKCIFDCDTCNHTFEKILCSITPKNFCPFCSGKRLCQDVDCKMCEEKSFLSHPLSHNWSSQNLETPRCVFKKSQKKYKFDCNICNHTSERVLSDVIPGSFCPFCTNQKLCDDLDCEFCFTKSFESHVLSKYWSKENSVLPRYVFKHSNKKYKLDCNVCNHVSERKLNDIPASNSFCVYCTGRTLCDNLDCDLCLSRSFLSHPMCKYWSTENKSVPRNVFLHSENKYKFNCPHCKSIYITTPANVSCGKWCTCTINKTETKLLKFLTSNYTQKISHQQKFDWCKNKKCLPFDFFIEEYNLIIELDGKQHFTQVHTWTSPDITQQNDIRKMKLANKHGFSVIRIYQPDVWKDENDWEKKLKKAIKEYTTVINIYIGTIYKSHPEYKTTYVK